MDDCVRRVLDSIDQAGITERTLVVFTSDNGPETAAYERAAKWGHCSMGAFRGLKRDLWEGGHRVPFLARWPGHVPAGVLNSETISLVDFFATATALVGAQLPANAAEDSYNILPALLGQELSKPIREASVYQGGNDKLALRQGPWVFIDAKSGAGGGGHNREPEAWRKALNYQPHDFPGELYDLDEDPGQHNNLYAAHPDKVVKLQALLTKYKTEGRSAPRP